MAKKKGFFGAVGRFLGSIPAVGKAKKAAKSVKKKAKAAKKKIKKAVKKAKKKLKKKIGKVFTKARKLKNNLSKSKLVKKIKRTVKKAVIKTKNAVKKAKAVAKSVKQKTKKAVQQVKQTAKATVAQAKQQVKTVVKETKKAMVKVGGKVATAYTSFKEGGYKEVLSVAVDFIPVVGNVKSAYEAVVGKDPITGRKLEDWERAVAVAGILGGPAVKAIKHGGKVVAATVKTTSPVLAKNAEKLKDTLESIASSLSFSKATVQLASVNSAGNGLSPISLVGKSPKKQQPASLSKQTEEKNVTRQKSDQQAESIDNIKVLKLEDFTKEILETKPMNSPRPERWYNKKGGEISIDDKGTWTYTNKSGKSVSYPNGYPDFTPYLHPDVPPVIINVHTPKNNNKDFKEANLKAGLSKDSDPPLPQINQPPVGYTWHHHEDGKTMMLVEADIHDEFKHIGGQSKVNGKNK